VAAGLLLLSLALVLASPLWLPAAAARIAERYGLTWETAETTGYARIRLAGVRYDGDGPAVTIDHLSLPQPLGWLRGWTRPDGDFRVSAGHVRVQLAEGGDGASTPPAPAEMREAARRLQAAQHWLPDVDVAELVISRADGQPVVAVGELELRGGALQGTLLRLAGLPATSFRAWLGAEQLRLLTRSQTAAGELQLRALARFGDAGWEIEADGLSAGVPGLNEPLVADIRIQADGDGFSVGAFTVEAGWLRAELSQPLHYHFSERAFATAALLRLTAELDQQSLFPATGTLSARVEARPTSAAAAELTFDVEAGRLSLGELRLAAATLSGRLRYPALTIDQAVLVLPDGLRIDASGAYDLQARAASVATALAFPAKWLDQQLPQLALRGPIDVELEADWNGAAPRRAGFVVRLDNHNGGRIAARGLVAQEAEGGRLRVELAEARVTTGDGPPLLLEAPFAVEMGGGPAPALVVGIEALDVRLLQTWTRRVVPAWFINELAWEFPVLAPVANGSFRLRLNGRHELVDTFELAASGTLGNSGLAVDSLLGSIEGVPFIEGSLRLPIQVHPLGDAGGERYSIIESGALEGALTAEIPPRLVRDHADLPLVGLLRDARADLSLGGTLDRPRAEVEAGFEELDLPGLVDPRWVGYPLQDLRISLGLTPERLEIRELRGSLRDARMTIAGSVAVESLRQAFSGNEPDWTAFAGDAELRAEFSGFRASRFQEILPQWLRPSGRARGEARLDPQSGLSGQFELENFGLRPTLYSQTVDRIRLSLDLAGPLIRIRDAGGFVGESAVEITGHIDLSDPRAPLFDIGLRGDKTPLVRTAELLLLADTELRLLHDRPRKAAMITGVLEIRDSVLIMDIDPLAARTAGPGMVKPPFFRIDTAPFGDWALDVAIRGEEALRFRSQVASALLSADLQLTGTLAQPVWVGQVTSSSGSVQFPGARLSLSRGEVFITRERQDSLQLDFSTIGQAASHIVSMRVRGSVEDPLVEFASTPALSNARILQLLATGSLQGGGLGSFGLYLGRSLLMTPGAGGDGFLDRLSVEVGRDISESGSNTVDVFYQLSERFRLHGQYDKYDAQNIDLEWEVFSR
jgi:hypothetical protein